MKLNLTAFWKWFWFTVSALVGQGPAVIAWATSTQLPQAVKIASFVLGLCGLLLTLHINPTPKPSTTPALPIVGGVLLMILCTQGLLAPTGCANPPSPAVVKSDLTTALDLTQAACSVADTTGVAYVILGCAITAVLENGAVQVANLFVPVSASQVSATLAAHPETEASKPLVLAWKALHPTAAVGPLPR